MKTRRFTVVAFLLAAVMIIGIGFANLSDLLTINGTINTNQPAANAAFDEKVYFSDAVADLNAGESTTTNEASVVSSTNVLDNNDFASLRVNTLGVENDTASFTLTIKNDSQKYNAVITVKSNTSDEYFKVDCVRADGETAIGDDLVCETGSTVQIKVIVTALHTFENAYQAGFTIELQATSRAKA